MHVAFVSLYPEQRRADGATARTRRVAEGLAARGHDVTFLCAQWWEGPLEAFSQNGVDYVAVTREASARAFASKLPFALRRAGPDVICAANSPPSQVVAAKTAARFLRVPVVVDWWTPREDDTERMIRRAARAADRVLAPSQVVAAKTAARVLRVPVVVDWWTPREDDTERMIRRAARAADRVLAPSQLVKTAVREHGTAAEDVTVVPGSVDFDLIRSAEIDSRADLVYARELDDHANVESFLLALAELRDREWRAVVIGDGPERDTVVEAAADLRIDDRVSFLGDLPPAEFVPILKGAHVFAQTGSVEPFARELLWALACGCVGIVEYQAASSAHELVENCERGARVTSPQELASEVVAAAGHDRLSVNEAFTAYHRGPVLDTYERIFAAERDDYGYW